MSVTKRDYYEILGVARDASEATLKSAYRKLALQYRWGQGVTIDWLRSAELLVRACELGAVRACLWH